MYGAKSKRMSAFLADLTRNFGERREADTVIGKEWSGAGVNTEYSYKIAYI